MTTNLTQPLSNEWGEVVMKEWDALYALHVCGIRSAVTPDLPALLTIDAVLRLRYPVPDSNLQAILKASESQLAIIRTDGSMMNCEVIIIPTNDPAVSLRGKMIARIFVTTLEKQVIIANGRPGLEDLCINLLDIREEIRKLNKAILKAANWSDAKKKGSP